MVESIRAAVCQMNSGIDKSENVRTALGLIRKANDRGARLICLPEMFSCFGQPEAIVKNAESIEGETMSKMAAIAHDLNIYLHAGSFPEETEEKGKVYNTSVFFGPDGEMLAVYRKIHLFDVHIPDRIRVEESSYIIPGDKVVIAETAHGIFGFSICYDLRFPELFRLMLPRGVRYFFCPAAFTLYTGRDHWEPLLKARAIENQTFMIAANQYGNHPGKHQSLGRSMVVDPWGTVLATAADGCWIRDCGFGTDKTANHS